MPKGAPSKASLIIETILKEKGLLDLEARTRKVEDEIKNSTSSAKKYDDVLAGLGKRLLAIVSVGALANFGKNLLTEFAQAERGINSIRHTMNQLGIDAEANLPKVVAQIKDIVRAGDIEYAQGLSVFEKLLGLTHSTEATQFLMDLSWKISEAKSNTMDFAGAADFLASVLQGKAKQAARELGIQWDFSLQGLEGNIALFEALLQQYGTFGKNTEDAADKTDRLIGSWAALRLVMSETIGPKAAWIFDFFGKVLLGYEYQLLKIERWWYDFKAGVADSAAFFSEFFMSFSAEAAQKKGFEAAYRSIMNNAQAIDAVNKRIKELQSFATSGGYSASAGFVDDWKKGLQDVRELLKTFYKQSQEASEEQEAERERKRLDKEAKDAAKERAKLAQEEADAVLEEERRKAQEIAEIINGLPVLTAEAMAGGKEKIEEFNRIIGLLREAAFIESVRMAKTEADQKAAIRDLELFRLNQNLGDQITLMRNAGVSEVDIARWVANEKEKIDSRSAGQKKKWTGIETGWEQMQGEATVEGRTRTAMKVFESTKAGAMASAFINLYEGITAIWKQWSAWPPIAAALTVAHVALCMKQIQAIRKQKFAAGFDDAYNDRMAYKGGRRWARDMVENFSAGAVDAGWRDGMMIPGASSADNRSYSTSYAGPTINIRTTYLDRTGIHLLYRELQQVGRLEQARKMR